VQQEAKKLTKAVQLRSYSMGLALWDENELRADQSTTPSRASF
jgi:hypothetical protein